MRQSHASAGVELVLNVTTRLEVKLLLIHRIIITRISDLLSSVMFVAFPHQDIFSKRLKFHKVKKKYILLVFC